MLFRLRGQLHRPIARRDGACLTARLVAAMTIAIGVSACAQQSSSPNATPIPLPAVPSASISVASPTSDTFTSARYGYSLVRPTGWKVTETPGSGGVHPGEPGVDNFQDLLGHSLSIVGEPAVPALAEWTCAIGQHLQGEHALAVEKVEDLTVAGVPARLSDYHLVISPYVIHYLTVEIVRGQQGLTLSLESTTGNDAEDRAILDAILGQLSFTG